MTWWQTILVALFGGGLPSLFILRVQRRKTIAEARKLEAEASGAESDAEGKVFEELRKLRAEFNEVTEHAQRCRKENDELHRRVSTVESVLPFALISKRLKDYHTLETLLDRLRDPIIVTSPANHGTILFANQAFCNALGRTPQEVLALQWKGMVHPDDADVTSAAEAIAWRNTVSDFVNRFFTAGGGIVWFRWLTPPYLHGVTIALAEVINVEGNVWQKVLLPISKTTEGETK